MQPRVSLETGPPPSGQLNAGVRKEEGLARRPSRARTQECGHLQFEAMRVHTPTVNSGLAVNMATYGKTCGHYILSVKYNRRLSSGVIASVVCADQLREGRSIEPDWNVFFWRKSKHRRVATALRRYTVS